MKFQFQAIVMGLTLIAGVAFAETEATDPDVIARQALMKTFGGAAKTLGGMASGDVAFDAAAAEAAKAVLVAGAASIPAKFEKNAVDPGAEAKPEVWTNWADYLVKAKGLGDAATALDASTVEGVQAGMGAIGGSCKSCHMAYRM